jgi:hypothetical protein
MDIVSTLMMTAHTAPTTAPAITDSTIAPADKHHTITLTSISPLSIRPSVPSLAAVIPLDLTLTLAKEEYIRPHCRRSTVEESLGSRHIRMP